MTQMFADKKQLGWLRPIFLPGGLREEFIQGIIFTGGGFRGGCLRLEWFRLDFCSNRYRGRTDWSCRR